MYVGERFNPAKVKRLAHGLIENPDDPPRVLLPELPPGTHPINVPDFPDLPMPKPLDPIDDLCDAIIGTPADIDAGRVCQHAADNDRIGFWAEFVRWYR